MNIPAGFRAAQQQAFQDKTVSHRPRQQITGSLNSITEQPATISATYLVNFQLISDAVLAQEWGLAVSRDAFMTRSATAPIAEKDYVQIGGVVYQVVGCPHHDSHFKWMLKATAEAVV